MLDTLRFDEHGLIPAVVQDFFTKQVLTVAYMNRESLEISIREGASCFYSRSRRTLWRKGGTSGNTQKIVRIQTDCDRDALVVEVIRAGPACHTGSESCFFETLYQSAEQGYFSAEALYRLLLERKEHPQSGSYTSYLFEKGIDKILKKVGEESAEVIIAGKGGDRAELVYEAADLYYHVLVLLAQTGIEPAEIARELARRHVVDHKTKQEPMG